MSVAQIDFTQKCLAEVVNYSLPLSFALNVLFFLKKRSLYFIRSDIFFGSEDSIDVMVSLPFLI